MRPSAEAAPRWGALAAALLLSAIHFASFFDPDRALLSDVRYFVYFAWRIAEGAVPHVDLFDNKTFLASYVGALLFRLGDGLGLDPLAAIRAGYLALSAVGGLLAFALFRRLGSGDAVAGGLGTLAYLSFGFLGALASVGNVPKLIMALCVPAMALCVHDRRWLLAGVLGGLAFLDWQIGILVWLAALVSAIAGSDGRMRAAARVTAGGALAVAPVALHYAWNDALGAAWRQTVAASLLRGAAKLSETGRPPWQRIARQVAESCDGHEWLFFAGLAGALWLPLCVYIARRGVPWRLLAPLAICHYGVLAFSLVDFQRYGDFLVLLHSIAFFTGVLWLALYRFVLGRLRSWEPGALHPSALRAGAVLLLAFVAARPGPLRPEIVLYTPLAPPGVTLSDQREVADRLAARSAGQRLAALDHAELLFLMRRPNPLPLAYWNGVAHRYYAEPGESFSETGARLLLSARPEVILWTARARSVPDRLAREFALETIADDDGRYRAIVGYRR